jgi:hypothetical protein
MSPAIKLFLFLASTIRSYANSHQDLVIEMYSGSTLYQPNIVESDCSVTMLIIPEAIWCFNFSYVHRKGEKLQPLISIKAGFRIRIQSGQ